mmetsp:Transcript_26222/g.66717  ORF Transcript_26222/g.66717 Transcript_26222/m.66717 type:complete len:246 (+) Transcript_26222:372-1109(+)
MCTSSAPPRSALRITIARIRARRARWVIRTGPMLRSIAATRMLRRTPPSGRPPMCPGSGPLLLPLLRLLRNMERGRHPRRRARAGGPPPRGRWPRRCSSRRSSPPPASSPPRGSCQPQRIPNSTGTRRASKPTHPRAGRAFRRRPSGRRQPGPASPSFCPRRPGYGGRAGGPGGGARERPRPSGTPSRGSTAGRWARIASSSCSPGAAGVGGGTRCSSGSRSSTSSPSSRANFGGTRTRGGSTWT